MTTAYRLGYVAKLYQFLIVFLLVFTGCTVNNSAGNAGGVDQTAEHTEAEHTETEHTEAEHTVEMAAETVDVLPALTPVDLAAGEKLQVVATTNLVADIVAQIGGEHIALYTLMAAGIDPHSYTTTPADMRTLTDADVIFINGVHLEEALNALLDTLAAPIVPVNVGVVLNEFAPEEEHAAESEAEHEEHEHGEADPHTWQSVANVKVWVENTRASLSQLDPTHADAYQAAADAYQQQLDTLDTELRAKITEIPVANRKLVTDHDTFGYFARDYDFAIIGALIPSLSTTAEPSAQSLAALQDQITQAGVKAIFVGTTVNPRLAEQMAQDLGIQVVSLYSDSLSAADGPAATYLDFMRYNVNAIVAALE